MVKRGPWRLVGVMAVVVAVLLGILLVTRGGGATSPADLLEGVPGAVDDAGTARLALRVDVNGAGMDVSVSGDGQVDFDTGTGSFDVDLLGRRIEMRTNGSTLFVRPAGDQQWMAVDATESGGALGSFGTGPSEAAAFVDLLRGDHGEIEERDREDIGQVDGARHLRTTIDVASAIDKASEGSRAALEQLATLAPKDGELPVDVWLDGDGRPVRERIRGRLHGVDLVMTVDLTRWGEALDVQVPPEGEVRDVEPEELVQLFSKPIG